MQTPERDFNIKISGLEIYNENVRDLLNSDSGRNLKLLDDPEVIAYFYVCHLQVLVPFSMPKFRRLMVFLDTERNGGREIGRGNR